MDFDAIVIGGGAAGLFCARTAALRGRRVVVLEHNARLGNKILISGGGRCNFTNIGATPANYITSGSPHFVKSALARYTPAHFLSLVEQHGIQWHEKKLGQLFCDQSSKQILQLLEDECRDAGVEVRLNCRVSSTARIGIPAEATTPSATPTPTPTPDTQSNPAGPRWEITTNQGRLHATSLVIATGALSFPKLGATPFGFDLARQFGIRVVPPRPGLVPLTFSPDDLAAMAELSGIAFECEATGAPQTPAFRENVLFTHRGLSGPSILQASNYWRAGEPIHLNLLPGQDALAFLESRKPGGRDLKGALRGVFPERFLQVFCARHGAGRPLTQLPHRELQLMASHLSQWRIVPAGDEGYLKAEVTVGGVDTAELSSKTLEARAVPGLFFIGEVVDVTGWLGGYNFQWAWSSGHAAGQAV